MDMLSAFTSGTGRIVYSLRRRPVDLSGLGRWASGVSLAWDGEKSELTAVFDSSLPPEDVNARLLPALVDFGVVSVVSGRSLEEAYLARRNGASVRS